MCAANGPSTMGKRKASYNLRNAKKYGSKVVEPNEESEEEAVLEPSEEECAPQSSSYKYDNDSKKLEEHAVEDPSDESEEDPLEEPIEELEEDPEEDPDEELEEDPEEEPTEQVEEDTEEEPSEELVEEETCEPSECVSLSHSDHYDDETQEPFEDPSEASLSETSSACDIDEAEHQSVTVPNNSNEKTRSPDAITGDSGALRGQSRKKCRKLESSNLELEVHSALPDLEGQSGLSMALNDNYATTEHEGTGSSGKQRRSRWDPQPEGDGKTGEDEHTNKKRKTRWASDISQLKMADAIQLPHFMKECVAAFGMDPKVRKLKAKLYEINSKLQRPELQDDRPEEERSPSPEPVYNNLGIRMNTREVRLHQKLIQQRQRIISKLIQKNPTFKPPSDEKSTKLFKKLYIPVKEYPGYNFIGLIIGPRGNTQKRMEKETGAKILLRGQGSSVTPQKHYPEDEDEDLHVRIEANNQKSLDAAVEMVEKLLIPVDEGTNEHKRTQLQELAKLNATLCRVCNEKGHQRYACPCLPSTFNIAISCVKCGSNIHPTASCPSTALPPHSNSLQGSSGSGLGLTPNTQNKPKKEIDVANLFVGCLPQVVDENRLKELFSPFGKLTEAKVIKDRTTGLSKGYGFVKFENAIDAAAAVTHMKGYKMDGKVLAVRIAGHLPVTGSSVLNHLPTYPSHAAAAVSKNVLNPIAWPGPPGSFLPEPKASLLQREDTSLLSTSIYTGNGSLLPKSEALAFTPPSGSSSFSNLDSGSRLHFPSQIPLSSPFSIAQFPGDPNYRSSQFQ